MFQQGKSQWHLSHFCLGTLEGDSIFCLLHIPHVLLHRTVTPTMCVKLTSPGKYLPSVLYLVLIIPSLLSSVSNYLTLTCYTTVVNYLHKLMFLTIICTPYWFISSCIEWQNLWKQETWNLFPWKDRVCFMLCQLLSVGRPKCSFLGECESCLVTLPVFWTQA